jgi:hypothetical protein
MHFTAVNAKSGPEGIIQNQTQRQGKNSLFAKQQSGKEGLFLC